MIKSNHLLNAGSHEAGLALQEATQLCDDALDLSRRVDTVKEENLKLKSENLVLGQYIENLMEASAIFQSTIPQTKKFVLYLLIITSVL